MTTEKTEQGDQYLVPGAERRTERPPTARELLERRHRERTKTAKPQKSFQSTELFGGLPPHQDKLF